MSAGTVWTSNVALCVVTRKVAHRSAKRAKTALNHRKAQGAPVTYVYKCRHCRKWHLTSQPHNFLPHVPNPNQRS